jgi:SAM-dependent methyltransferase
MLPLIYAKYDLAAQFLMPTVLSVLDVGCRDGVLKKHLRPDIEYVGIDMHAGPAVTKVCNIDTGIPFDDASFDAVIALDVLEHTDNIWFVFDELIRVAKRQIVVVLPNAYHWKSRLNFMFGHEMDKHALPAEPISDRHRWLVSHNRARTLCQHVANKNGLSLNEQVLFGGRRTVAMDIVLDCLNRNIAAWATMFTFQRPSK